MFRLISCDLHTRIRMFKKKFFSLITILSKKKKQGKEKIHAQPNTFDYVLALQLDALFYLSVAHLQTCMALETSQMNRMTCRSPRYTATDPNSTYGADRFQSDFSFLPGNSQDC